MRDFQRPKAFTFSLRMPATARHFALPKGQGSFSPLFGRTVAPIDFEAVEAGPPIYTFGSLCHPIRYCG